VSRIPTALLLALGLGYAIVLVRVPTGFGPGRTFEPLEPRPRVVSQLIAARQFAEALPLAVELRQSYPDEPEIVYWLAAIHHGLSAWRDEAAAWEDYIRVSATPEAACPALPEAYARLGDVSKTLAAYERCRALDPQNPDRLFDLAIAYERSGRGSDAIPLYRQAAALDPHDPALGKWVGESTEGGR